MFNEKENLDELIAATARLLLRSDQIAEASLLTHSRVSAWQDENYEDLWLIWVHVPIDVYAGLNDKQPIEDRIDRVMDDVITSMAAGGRGRVYIKVDTKFDYHKDWRAEMARILSGETVSNQGRVRSTNIATIQEDGLLFRSEPEVMFYRAAKKAGLVFAPLPVFLQRVNGKDSRREPDFVIVQDGITLIVELDGRTTHRESPVEAQQRLAFLTDQGVKLHRIPANNCWTEENAARCVNEVKGVIERLKKLR
jgi:hypothetical protein